MLAHAGEAGENASKPDAIRCDLGHGKIGRAHAINLQETASPEFEGTKYA